MLRALRKYIEQIKPPQEQPMTAKEALQKLGVPSDKYSVTAPKRSDGPMCVTLKLKERELTMCPTRATYKPGNIPSVTLSEGDSMGCHFEDLIIKRHGEGNFCVQKTVNYESFLFDEGGNLETRTESFAL